MRIDVVRGRKWLQRPAKPLSPAGRVVVLLRPLAPRAQHVQDPVDHPRPVNHAASRQRLLEHDGEGVPEVVDDRLEGVAEVGRDDVQRGDQVGGQEIRLPRPLGLPVGGVSGSLQWHLVPHGAVGHAPLDLDPPLGPLVSHPLGLGDQGDNIGLGQLLGRKLVVLGQRGIGRLEEQRVRDLQHFFSFDLWTRVSNLANTLVGIISAIVSRIAFKQMSLRDGQFARIAGPNVSNIAIWRR